MVDFAEFSVRGIGPPHLAPDGQISIEIRGPDDGKSLKLMFSQETFELFLVKCESALGAPSTGGAERPMLNLPISVTTAGVLHDDSGAYVVLSLTSKSAITYLAALGPRLAEGLAGGLDAAAKSIRTK